MMDITIQNRAMIFKVTVPVLTVERHELRDIENDFNIGTKMQLEISIGEYPKMPNTSDLWCKITYSYDASRDMPFTVETMKSVLLSTFRNYFAAENSHS